ncbi:MAG: response regulator [Bacillota bacterium]
MADPLILVVEDDTHLTELLRLTLEHAHFRVAVAHDGLRGLALFRAAQPAMVVLDLALPGMDGMDVCRELRRESKVPILMLTGRGEELDRVRGLEAGADDYMVKPFSPLELVARVRAILRRAGGMMATRLEFPSLTIDIDRREVRVQGETVSLAPKEFDLLVALAQHPGRAFSRDDLLRNVWGYTNPLEGRTVDEHIRRLRTKIETRSHPYRYIRTVWSIGYKFEVIV